MNSRTRYPRLMEPGYIGSVKTRNRILKTGANPGFYEYIDGHVHDNYIAYYEAIARGGAGIVTVAAADIDYPRGLTPNVGYRIDDDKYIPDFTKLAEVIHKYTCPAFLQMFHTGPLHPSFISGLQPVAASSLSKSELPKPQLDIARELSIPEIEDLANKFIKAAGRARQAGFNGIELNAGHGHLLNSFLSRAWNKRHDAYGCDNLENRTRIVANIIQEIKRNNGKDFAVIALINGGEPGLEKGITPHEGCEISRLLQAAGADAVHVRVEFYMAKKDDIYRESTHFPEIVFYPESHTTRIDMVEERLHGPGGWIPFAAAVKKVITVPVIAVGRLDPEIGEKAISQGKADFISLNRRFMADHELPNKIAANRLKDIAPCTSCFTCFEAVETFSEPPTCRINASLGREREYEIKPAEKKKTVLIAGGGPAGMEAARVAALRGHRVILYEKETKLGGSLPVAGIVKGFEREDLMSIVEYLKTQMVNARVEIKLEREFTRATIDEIKPDVFINAVGGVHQTVDIAGIEKSKVITSHQLQNTMKNYLRFFSPRFIRLLTNLWMPVGKKVLVIGGGIHGCQVAEFLVKRGKKVTIVDEGKDIGQGLVRVFIKPMLLEWLAEKGVRFMTEVKYKEINDRGMEVTDKNGRAILLEADIINTALPLKPNVELAKDLKGIVPEIYSIGDCEEPGLIINAIAAGSRIARLI